MSSGQVVVAASAAVLPANADPQFPGVFISSVSCASVGNCTAVGTYLDNSSNEEGLLLTETAGVWATGVEAVLPANAAATNELLHLDSVSCASPGNCSAVGGYTDTSRNDQGLLLTETSGKWSKGVEAVPPGDPAPVDQIVAFPSVSCPSAGNCVAVGDYRDAMGNGGSLVFTETAGIWSAGFAPGLPPNASTTHYSNLQSVSCPSVGNCSAVGNFTGSQGYGQGLMLKETAGKWATGNEAKLPAGAISNQLAALDSVSCASAGNCSAVGTYYDNNGQEALLLTETAGHWGTGIKATLPSNAAATNRFDTTVASISCPSAGNCAAVGGYENNSGTEEDPGTEEPLLLSETNGIWASGIEADLPADRAPLADASLVSVSCASVGNCTAVGDYVLGTTAPYPDEALLVTETAGTWARGTEVNLPLSELGEARLSSVSCASAGDCSAVGIYGPASECCGLQQGLLVGTTSTPTKATLKVSQTGAGTGTVTSSPAGIDCGLTCVASFDDGTQVTLTASPDTGSTFTGWSGGGCSGTGNCQVTVTTDTTVTATFAVKPMPPIKCVVPRLKGEALAAAKHAIKAHGCSVGKITHAASLRIKKGHVITQKPKPGTRLKHGANISFVVSRGEH